MTRHFLRLADLSGDELRRVIARAIELKAGKDRDRLPLRHKTLAMVFTKSSTRTRVSFEVGMAQLGGHALFLSPRDTQLGRNEPLADTARVLSRMCDGIMVRNDSQSDQAEIARNSRVPVINGLSDLLHPCQLLADMQTYFEHRGDIRGATVAWIGDGNNVCNTFAEAAHLLGFKLKVACPKGYEPDAATIRAAGTAVEVASDPHAAAAGANLVVTDVWASMGQEDQQQKRAQAFAGYQVDASIMKAAHRDALFMHCLPAHRGEEVAAEVIDGPQSVVWDEAGNRLHAQKALLEMLLA